MVGYTFGGRSNQYTQSCYGRREQLADPITKGMTWCVNRACAIGQEQGLRCAQHPSQKLTTLCLWYYKLPTRGPGLPERANLGQLWCGAQSAMAGRNPVPTTATSINSKSCPLWSAVSGMKHVRHWYYRTRQHLRNSCLERGSLLIRPPNPSICLFVKFLFRPDRCL